jgi:hypothetical protein
VLGQGADGKVYATFRTLATNQWSGSWTSIGTGLPS